MQTVVPDCGADGLRRNEIVAEADAMRERDGLRHPGQERIGALVDLSHPGERTGVDSAADTAGAVEHHELGVGVGK